MNAWKMIKAAGDEFMSDPCAMDHVCTPNEAAEDKAKRIGYEKVRDVKDDPLYAGRVPRQVYEEMLTKASQEHGIYFIVPDDVISALYGWGYGMKRQAISRRRDGILKKFVQGRSRVLAVAEWWDTIKRGDFLPRRLYPEVRALWAPPVPQDQSLMVRARTSLSTCTRRGLMVRLRICGINGRRWICEPRILRKRTTKPQWRKTSEEAGPRTERKHRGSMRRFGEIYRARGVTRNELEDYCRYMSRYVSGKTI
ncbi:hypothetical protein COOONC_10802 [Cooperia oncophora]